MNNLIKPALWHCAGPSCPGYSFRASEFPHPPSCAKLVPTPEDQLEETLRLSVAENDARKVPMQTADDIKKAIEAQTTALYAELNTALQERDRAEDRVKAARAAIAAAPRLHVPRKYPGRRKSKSSELEAKLATGEVTEPLTDITGCDV